MQGLLLDFNGTVSEDEWLLCSIFQDLFADEGLPLAKARYYEELAGLSDPEIVERWIGEPRPDLVARKASIYRERAASGDTVHPATRVAIQAAAERVPVAIVSGAARDEIDLVLGAARVARWIAAIVAAEDVTHGKPHPEGYRRALNELGVQPSDGVAVEDSHVGVQAARAAGLRCLGITTTFATLPEADELADSVYDAIARIGLLDDADA